jgi:hypothetical protein
MNHHMLVLLCCLALSVTAEPPQATLAVPPEEKDILGAWIGFDTEAVFFYRLTITDKVGSFAYSFPNYPVRCYGVASWSLKQGAISLDMTNSTKVAELIHASGRASNYRLDLTVEAVDGTGGKWTRKVSLFREGKMEARVRELQQAMNPRSPYDNAQRKR